VGEERAFSLSITYVHHGKIVLLFCAGPDNHPFSANNLALFLGYQAQPGRRIAFMTSPNQNSIFFV
jgi:hypothetical protein